MDGGEYQMAGLRCYQGSFNGLRGTHFSDEDHIRVLSQGSIQSVFVIFYVHANLSLVDNGFFRCVNILNRIIQCNNMKRSCLVDLI